jgi:transposase-like protein
VPPRLSGEEVVVRVFDLHLEVFTGMSKSRVSEIAGELDDAVTAFRTRPLETPYPYLWRRTAGQGP